MGETNLIKCLASHVEMVSKTPLEQNIVKIVFFFCCFSQNNELCLCSDYQSSLLYLNQGFVLEDSSISANNEKTDVAPNLLIEKTIDKRHPKRSK